MNGLRLMQWAARLLLALTVLLVALTALRWLAQRAWFNFPRIEVHGELHHVSGAAVRAAVAGRLAGNFFTMHLDDTRRAFEAVPWVARTSVRRVWPNRLVVTLTEHRALGVWSDGRLLSDAGVLFVANPDEAESDGPLIDFAGPAQYALDAVRRYQVASALLAPLALRVTAVDVSDRASWSLQTQQLASAARGPRLELGRDEPAGRVQQRLQAIAANYPLVVAQLSAVPVLLDARYGNGFAARARQ